MGCYNPLILEGHEWPITSAGRPRQGRLGRTAMSTLQRQVAEKFLAKLADTGMLEPERIEQFRVLLANGKKLKAEELVKLFSAPAGGDIK